MNAEKQNSPPGRAGSTAALGAALGIALWLTGAGAAKGGVLIGTPDGSSFVPFGGLTAQLVDVLTEDFPGDPNFDPTLVPRFQQVYSSSAFAGPLTILLIEFFEFNPPGAPSSALLGGTFTLQLSTTALSLDGLACCDAVSFDSNLGGDVSVFALDVSLSTIFSGGRLSFPGAAFNYDPSLGNLLLDVQIGGFDPNNAVADLILGGKKFFQQTTDTIGGGPLVSTVDNFNGQDNLGIGLVTLLTPEPSTFFLMSSGLLVLGLLPRRRGAAL